MIKYDYKSDRYSSHSKIINIIEESENALKILDIGCASGYIGKRLKKRHHLTGIEMDKGSAKKAKKFYNKLLVLDLEKENVKVNDKFDIIILGDVLEHLKNPLNLLIKAKKLLKRGGKVIISLPNVAFIFVRASLLAGKFNYMEKGPLDKEHLRFFTLKSSKKLILDAGLDIKNAYAIPAPLPLIFRFIRSGSIFYFIQIINNFITQLWKKGFAYQFVFVASG